MNEPLTWKDAMVMVAVWVIISLFIGYAFGRDQGQEVGFKDGYAAGREESMPYDMEARIESAFEDWLGKKPPASTQERTI